MCNEAEATRAIKSVGTARQRNPYNSRSRSLTQGRRKIQRTALKREEKSNTHRLARRQVVSPAEFQSREEKQSPARNERPHISLHGVQCGPPRSSVAAASLLPAVSRRDENTRRPGRNNTNRTATSRSTAGHASKNRKPSATALVPLERLGVSMEQRPDRHRSQTDADQRYSSAVRRSGRNRRRMRRRRVSDQHDSCAGQTSGGASVTLPLIRSRSFAAVARGRVADVRWFRVCQLAGGLGRRALRDRLATTREKKKKRILSLSFSLSSPPFHHIFFFFFFS